MKLVLMVFGTLSLTLAAQAQQGNSMELTCRSQAKEVAVQTYQSCVTTARKQRVDEIRKEYQAKLTELKSHYDSELKKLAPNSAGSSGTAVSSKGTAKVSAKSKKSRGQNSDNSGIAQTLPQKKLHNVQTLPIQAVPEVSMSKSSDENSNDSVSSADNDDSVNVVEPGSQDE